MHRFTAALMAAAAVVAFGAPAAAQVTVTAFRDGFVELDSQTTSLGSLSRGVIDDEFGAAGVTNIVQTGNGPIVFESGLTVGGPYVVATATSGIDVTITNTTNTAFIPRLQSSIIPAGMGVFAADRSSCDSPFAIECAPSTRAENLYGLTPSFFESLFFAGSSFLFEVMSEGEVLYSVAASMGFALGEQEEGRSPVAMAGVDPQPEIPGYIDYFADYADAASRLTGFEIVADQTVPGHFGFRWDATAFEVSGLSIAPGESRSFQYRATVSAFSLVDASEAPFPVVLYAGFGDPVGRPGAACCASASFSEIEFLDTTFTIQNGVGTVGIVIDPVAGVPEPQAWALMIAGLGLVGGVLRRRVRTLAA